MSEAVLARPLWRLHDVRIAIPARAVSQLGDSVLAIVLLLYIQHAAVGVWPVALVLAVESVPLVLLMGIAGQVADRYDSRAILVTATAGQVFACTVLAFTHVLTVMFLLLLVIQTGQAFAAPTWTALMPRVVGEEGIGRLVALQSGIAAFAGPLGAGAGGLLYGTAGARAAILADAGTFALLLCAAMLVRTRRAAGGPGDDRAPVGFLSLTALFAGFSVIRRDAVVWPMMWALAASIVVVGGVNVVDVFFVRVTLHTSATLYGLSEIVAAIGAVAGSVIAARSGSVGVQVKVAFAGFAAVGLGCLGIGLSPDFAVYLCFALLVGLANTAVNATFAAVLIQRTPEADRGKAAASLNGVAQVGMVAALVLGGTAGQAFGPRTTFVIAGIGAVAVAIGAAALAAAREAGSR